jgi:hypothetical protein
MLKFKRILSGLHHLVSNISSFVKVLVLFLFLFLQLKMCCLDSYSNICRVLTSLHHFECKTHKMENLLLAFCCNHYR